jgi:hypothetical protein
MSDWGTRAHLITSALSIARELWRYGEPDLAHRAMALTPDQVLDLGVRMMELYESGDAERLWPDGPKDKAFILGAIEHLEGAPRPARRRIRRPESQLPWDLQASRIERLDAATPVSNVLHARLRKRKPSDIHQRD